jgi:hypothetical protein
VVALHWQPHRLDALPDTNPCRLRPDEALGFILVGEPADPAGARVLDVRADSKSPMPRYHSAWVTPWSKLHRFFA